MPTPADAFHQARAARRDGDGRRAEQLCRELLRADPGHAPGWHLLGDVLAAAGRPAEAAEALGQAVRLRPDSADGYYGLGNALAALQRPQEAADAFQQVLRLQPDHAEALSNLGIALAGLGRLDDAVIRLRRAVQVRPDFAQGHNNLGVALAQKGQSEEALACFERALEVQPDYAEASFNLGNALGTLGRRDDAIARYRRTIEVRPDHGGTWNNLGLALTESGRAAEAVVVLQQAVRLRPQAVEAHTNLGLAYAELGRFAEAEASYREALRLDPKHVEAHTNLGNAYKEQGRLDEALACYQTALCLNPDSASTHYNRSLALLQAGDYARGWPAYEWRWRRPKEKLRLFRQPRWGGEPLKGRTVLLWCEQGLGDTLQFVRFAPLVQRRGGRVVLECPGFLIPLLSTCPGIDQLVAESEEPPPADVQAPLMSLPGLLGTTVETVPAEVPYLRAEPERVEKWRQRLAPEPGFKVGVVWQGNRHFQWDRYRSIPLKYFALLARVEGVRLISLQKGHGAEQVARVGKGVAVTELGDEVDPEGGFLDTAAVMQNLDLVVTADTSAGHLAGALGVPVWLALSAVADWRWLVGRAGTPWYPTMRLFRQRNLGDWGSVFRRMAQALGRKVRRGCFSVGVNLSPGELLDRLSILEIKTERITDSDKLAWVHAELAHLKQVRDRLVPASEELAGLATALKRVNESLWGVEDALRLCERNQDFGPEFVALARSVYRTNDERGALKRKINELLGSPLQEQKAYPSYP